MFALWASYDTINMETQKFQGKLKKMSTLSEYLHAMENEFHFFFG